MDEDDNEDENGDEGEDEDGNDSNDDVDDDAVLAVGRRPSLISCRQHDRGQCFLHGD